MFENSNEDYLNTVLEDGLTIREHMEKGIKKAMQNEKTSSNPKFHRSFNESEASFEFSQKYYKEIENFEHKIYSATDIINIADFSNITENIQKCKKAIEYYQDFKKFCYSHNIGGKIYFQDNWEYCHNFKNECFEYISSIEIYLQKLQEK